MSWPGGSFSCSVIHTSKSCGFNSQLGHISMLQVRSLVRVYMRGNQLMFPSLSEINKTYPQVGIVKKIPI